jgi:predicted amidohydrolase
VSTATDVTLALGQLSIEPGAHDRNLDSATTVIERAAADGADIVALPELFTVGYFSFDLYDRVAEPLDGPTLDRLAACARDNDVAVLAGTIVEDLGATSTDQTPAEDGLANTAVLFDASGEQRLVYRKHHLFGYGSAESELLVPGERVDVADLCGLTVGVTTCYDLRFPELFRRLADRGVELVLVPSAWPYPRVEHWRLLGRARAVENLCYVATVNGSATFESASLVGRSSIYDPWGTTLASSGETPTVISATISPDRVTDVREEFPALADRRQRGRDSS